MTVEQPHDYPGAALVIANGGFEVEVESTWPHEILLTVEHDDFSGYGKPTKAERYVGIDPEDWDAIVAYVTAERERLQTPPLGEERLPE